MVTGLSLILCAQNWVALQRSILVLASTVDSFPANNVLHPVIGCFRMAELAAKD